MEASNKIKLYASIKFYKLLGKVFTQVFLNIIVVEL